MSPEYDFGPGAARRSLRCGDVLCHEGAADSDVFQIVSGLLNVERTTEDGPMVVASVGRGSLVGEVTNAMGGRRTATLRATEPTVVAAFTQEEFADWLDENPDQATGIAAEARLRANRSRAAGVLAKLFGLDNQDVVDAVVRELQWLTLAPGDYLFEQGDESDAAYLLIAGRLHLEAVDIHGVNILDIEIGRGEIVGEMGILNAAPRNAGALAIRETTVARISKEAFEAITSVYPSLVAKVLLTIVDRLTHQTAPNDRARVVAIGSTIPDGTESNTVLLASAVEPFGSTLHLSSKNLSEFVRDPAGSGGSARVAEFLHESDVAHDFVLLEADEQLTDWTISSLRQSDRFVLLCSANPDDHERERMRALLEVLSKPQRASAWIARVHPSSTLRPRNSAQFIEEFEVGEVHNLRAGSAAHMTRVGRLSTGNGRGVVLGGGGAKGLAHIGALRALREAGIEYDRVGGASMGAAIGGFAAKDLDEDQMLEVAIKEFRKDLLDYTVPLVSLVKAEKMAAGIENQFGGWDIEDFWIPYFCVSTNITKSQLCVHRRGPVSRAIRASVAIPVVLPPVPIDGDLHVDGGVLDNVPVTSMRDDSSIGTVIAIDVSPPGGPEADTDFGLSVSGFEALRSRLSKKRSFSFPDIGTTLMSSMLIGSSQAKNQSTHAGVVDLYIDLDLEGVGLLKFENHAEVAQRGYDGAKPAISTWLQATG